MKLAVLPICLHGVHREKFTPFFLNIFSRRHITKLLNVHSRSSHPNKLTSAELHICRGAARLDSPHESFAKQITVQRRKKNPLRTVSTLSSIRLLLTGSFSTSDVSVLDNSRTT